MAVTACQKKSKDEPSETTSSSSEPAPPPMKLGEWYKVEGGRSAPRIKLLEKQFPTAGIPPFAFELSEAISEFKFLMNQNGGKSNLYLLKFEKRQIWDFTFPKTLQIKQTTKDGSWELSTRRANEAVTFTEYLDEERNLSLDHRVTKFAWTQTEVTSNERPVQVAALAVYLDGVEEPYVIPFNPTYYAIY